MRLLVGVNPVYGLYASFAGPIAGGLTASTRLMVITTTTAAALAAGSAVAGFDADKRPEALFILTVLAGAVMLAAGLLRLGRYTRFVSFSAMIGFLTGVAANIIFGQIPDLAGASATGDVALAKALDVVLHPAGIELASLLTGAAALPGGRFAERTAPSRLPSHAVTLLDVYGSLSYAGAKTLAARLPAVGGRLILSGATPELVKQLRRTGREHLDAEVSAFPATDVIGDSSDAAYGEAERWLASGAKALAQ